MRLWCYWHVECIDEQKPVCTAHMHEGRAFPCPYTSLEDAKAQVYPCLDAKPCEEDQDA